jgi:hypothetical protein
MMLKLRADPNLSSNVNIEETTHWPVQLVVRSSTARSSTSTR